MKSSIGSRSLKLIGLAARVGSKELSQNIKSQFQKGMDELSPERMKTRVEQAKIIADNLAQLKGAAMKAGQLLSLDATDFMPPEAVEILSKLQSKADPVEWKVLEKVLLKDLGEEGLDDFTELSQKAVASASIGQVHRGVLDGKDVAVKIQYPGVADSIDSDLRILKRVASSFLSVTGKKIDLTELFEELAIVLKQETDYELELRHMQKFRELLAPFPDYVVPTAYPTHSGKKVLTMSFEEGLSFSQWLDTNPSKEERQKIGRLVLDLYCKEFYEWGFVQTDPNYANFLVQPKPLKLVLLDFGAALSYTPEFRMQYLELLKALGTLDKNEIIRAFTDFGLIDQRESEKSLDLFAELLLNSMEPFRPEKQPFKFKDDDYARRSRDISQRFTQSLKFSAPPRKILFLHRKLGGIFTLLKKLDIELDVYPYWQQMVGAKIGETQFDD